MLSSIFFSDYLFYPFFFCLILFWFSFCYIYIQNACLITYGHYGPLVQHQYRDGRLEEVVPRHLGHEDGSAVIAKNIRLHPSSNLLSSFCYDDNVHGCLLLLSVCIILTYDSYFQALRLPWQFKKKVNREYAYSDFRVSSNFTYFLRFLLYLVVTFACRRIKWLVFCNLM